MDTGQGKVNFDKVNEAEKREGSGLRQGVVWWSGRLGLELGNGGLGQARQW